MDKIIEKSFILSKLMEITDMKLYLARREVELRDELHKTEEYERENSNS